MAKYQVKGAEQFRDRTKESVAKFEQQMKVTAQFADTIICNSNFTKDRVMHWFNHWWHRPNTLVAPLGLDLPTLQNTPLPSNLRITSPYVVIVGTIEPRKNHALLLDIWDEFASDGRMAPQLVIAGSRGWKNDDVFRRLDRGIRNVIEAANLSDSDLAALVASASAMVFPSLAEGYGLPPAEALALGTPVLCNDLPIFREILGNSPIYANADDMYLWKQSILRIAGIEGANDAGKTDSNGTFRSPTWRDHFNIVLNHV